MSFTDYLRLGEQKMFRVLREALPPKTSKTQNLLASREGVLYAWNFQDNCVLTLNAKAARCKDGDDVCYQTLLPTSPPLFTPELVTVNDAETLLVVAGPSGVLVLELPARTPPHGSFANNKEVIYCRSHSLDERLLACSTFVEVRQVRFHPGSPDNNHVLVLTSDNVLRLYQIHNAEAVSLGTYEIGRRPMAAIPGTRSKTSFLGALGETAVDFDFALPEFKRDDDHVRKLVLELADLGAESGLKAIEDVKDKGMSVAIFSEAAKSLISRSALMEKGTSIVNAKKIKKSDDLCWPIYLLRGEGFVYMITIDLDNPKIKPHLKGPLPMPIWDRKNVLIEACSIVCLLSNPSILCVAFSNGNIHHSIVLPISDEQAITFHNNHKNINRLPDRALYTFESVALELGLSTSNVDPTINCPIFLHKDESKVGRYFASHETGVHSIIMPSVDDLEKFVASSDEDNQLEDLLREPSITEYLICTKTANSEDSNPIIGFALYYYPTCVMALLADGNVISLAILTTVLMPDFENSAILENVGNINSPLKKMLKEPFDAYIQKILKQVTTQPILKLSQNTNYTQKECHELLLRASQVFREEYFRSHNKAREEIEKRVKTLQLLKKYQLKEVEKMTKEKQILQEKAEHLAEKYEDIKDKQDELIKRCERALILVSHKKDEPSDAEKNFVKELKNVEEKIQKYLEAMDRMKMKQKYQTIQMETWKKDQKMKVQCLSDVQTSTIKNNLEDMTNRITQMQREVVDYKKLLNLKEH